MNEQLLERLDYLAAKLGTTADYLWPKLVQHSFTGSLTLCIASATLAVATGYITTKVYKEEKDTEPNPWDMLGQYVGTFGAATITILLLILSTSQINNVFVPEVAALEKITKLIK